MKVVRQDGVSCAGLRHGGCRFLLSSFLVALLLPIGFAQADFIRLITYASFSLEESPGHPLPYGSIVMIFGSADEVNDGLFQDGNGYVPDSVRNDDVLLGTVYIGDPYYTNNPGSEVLGSFVSDMQIAWDRLQVAVNYLYMRFFNAPVLPDRVATWGESSVQEAVVNFSVAEAEFDVSTNGLIGDRVWYDLNGNGLQDAGEPGAPDVRVYLYRDGSRIATNVTGDGGSFLFDGLSSGFYQLAFDTASFPPGHVVTHQGPLGLSDPDDSDPARATGMTEAIPLAAGQQDRSWDLGLIRYEADVSLTKTATAVPEYPLKWSIPISKGQQFTDGDYWLRLESGKPSFDVWGPGNLKSSNTLDATWHHVVGRFTRGTGTWGPHRLEILVDGVVVTSKVGRGATDTSEASLFLGAYMGNSGFYGGLMDEVRLSRGLRSDAWLRATWAQQANPGAFLSVGPQEPSARPGYAWQRALTIDGALIGEELTDFPVLVNLTDEWLATGVLNADGSDLLFATAGGAELAREIELFERASGRLVAWVKAPSVAAGSATTIVLHYGNPAPAAPAWPPTAVWDEGFMMVQHLNETTGPVKDSTWRGNDGTVHGARPTEFGSANGGYEFDGKDDQIEVPNDASIQLNTTSFTMEGWFARKALPADTIFEVTVRNEGPDTALEVVVEDALAPKFTLVKAQATKGFYDGATGRWTVGDLEAGETATLRLAARINEGVVATNVAEVASCLSWDPDSVPGNGNAGEDDWASAVARAGFDPDPNRKPDFVVTDIQFVPDPLVAGGEFAAVVTVANQGTGAGDAGTLKVWLNRAGGATAGEAGDAEQAVGALAVGESKPIAFGGLTAPSAAGTYTFRAFADGNNATAEQSEGNNQKTRTYSFSATSPGRPDFVVTDIQFDPDPLVRGGVFTATVTVKNQGSASGDAGMLSVWVKRATGAQPGEPGDAERAAGVLGVGESRAVVFENLDAPPKTGTYTFRAYVDSRDEAVEQSEGNNQKTRTYSFSAPSPGKPDFAVNEIRFEPDPLVAGGGFTAVVVVTNQGSAAGDAGRLKIWLNRSTGAPAGEPGDVEVDVGVLESKAGLQVSFGSLTAPSAAGTYTFRAFVDGDNATAELSEGNNQKTRTYSFAGSNQGRPDFLVTDIQFSPEPAAGGEFTAYVAVKNQGSAPGDAGSVDVWLHRPTGALAGESGDAWQAAGALLAGETRLLTFPGLVAPAASGTYRFRAFVDSRGETSEQSEGNNQSTRTYSY